MLGLFIEFTLTEKRLPDAFIAKSFAPNSSALQMRDL
jgi:hypothetical protein